MTRNAHLAKVKRNAAMLAARDEHGYSYREIGKIFGVSAQVAEKIVKREAERRKT